MEAFAKRLRELRGKRTQAEIAEKIGMKPATYAAYENGNREPSMGTLIRLADLYNVSLDDLFGRDSVEDRFTKRVLTSHLILLQKDIQNVIDEINR